MLVFLVNVYMYTCSIFTPQIKGPAVPPSGIVALFTHLACVNSANISLGDVTAVPISRYLRHSSANISLADVTAVPISR